MARDQPRLDRRDQRLDVTARGVEQVDLVHATEVEQAHRPLGRQVDGVVHVEAEQLALGGHHPDHPVAFAADTDRLAERRARAEQLVAQLGTEHRLGACRADLPGLEEAPLGHLQAPQLGRRRTYPEHHPLAPASVPLDVGVALHHRRHFEHARQVGERLGILERQRAGGVHHGGRHAEGAGAPRRHAEQIGAELGELAEHETADPLADRGQQHHRGDADADAEHGQQAARRVGQHPAPRHLCLVGEAHRYLRASAVTGSRRAAWRAGNAPNSRPMPSASNSAAGGAQVGALKSRLG